MQDENRYAPPQAQVDDVGARAAARPALWNPGAAASWSLLLTPIFGSLLHMANWRALGEPEKAETSRRWALANVAYIALVVLTGLVLPDSRGIDALTRIGGLALLIGWYYAIGKSQQAFVLARFGRDYPRRGWLRPIGLAVLAMLGFMVAAGIVGAALGALGG